VQTKKKWVHYIGKANWSSEPIGAASLIYHFLVILLSFPCLHSLLVPSFIVPLLNIPWLHYYTSTTLTDVNF